MNTDFNIEDGLGYNLGTTFFAMGALLTRRLAEGSIELTHRQAKLLMFLGHHEGIKQQQAATILQKDKPTITKMIDILEKKDLVVRKADPNDRRNRLLFLTSDGKKLWKKILPIVKQTFEEAGEALSEKEHRVLIDNLKKLRHHIQQKINTET